MTCVWLPFSYRLSGYHTSVLSLHLCLQAKPPREPPKDAVSALLLAVNGYEVASLKPALPLIRQLYQALLNAHTQTCQYSWAPKMQEMHQYLLNSPFLPGPYSRRSTLHPPSPASLFLISAAPLVSLGMQKS